jgi:hypothetical protein
MKVVYAVKPQAVIVATVLVGVAPNVLNVPDQLKKSYRSKPDEFENAILPRLSSGDQSLWNEFEWAVSANKKTDPAQTLAKFRMLRTRQPGHTHVEGYDYVLIVPVHIDNVNPPRVEVDNALGIDVSNDYKHMIEIICKAYSARWHL